MAASDKQSKAASTSDSGSVNDSGSTSNMTDTATNAAGQVQETVVGLKDQVTSQVKEQASTQLMSRLETVTGTLDMATKLLRTAGDTVRQQDKAGTADAITGFADRLEGWSSSIREQDVDKLLEETKQVAQKQPALFVAGAATLGFLGARFFASSAKKQEEQAAAAKDLEQQTAQRQQEQSSSDTRFSSSPSPADVARSMSTLPPMTDMSDMSASSTGATADLDYTTAYPSVEENAAIEASMEAPFESDDTMVFEDEIVVPDFDDSTHGTKGSTSGTGDR